MLIRFVVATLILFLSLGVRAETRSYNFEGYVSAVKKGTDPATQFVGGAPGYEFRGSIYVDTERFIVDPETGLHHYAPIRGFYIVGLGAVADPAWFENTSNLDSTVEVSSSATLEQLRYSISGPLWTPAGESVNADVVLHWASSQTGQLPAPGGEASIEPSDLDPNNWTISIVNRGSCQSACEPDASSELRGNITVLWSSATGRPYDAHRENFDAPPASWTSQGGAWSVNSGTYRNAANVQFTSSVYSGRELTNSYSASVQVYSQWSGSGNTLGMVLHYTDALNYDEVRVNMLGTVTYSRVRNGQRTILGTGQATGVAPRESFQIWVLREGSVATVQIAGPDPDLEVDVGAVTGGYAGVFSSWNQARFDDLNISYSIDWLSERFDFASSEQAWAAQSGIWTVSNGYFYSSSNLAAAVATSEPIEAADYSIDTSMYLEWSNAGNRGGVVYDYQDANNYRAVLISTGSRTNGSAPFNLGVIEAIEVRNGVRRSVQRSELPILPKDWTTVGVKRLGDVTTVTGFGEVFSLRQPITTGTKRVGLIASYNKVRFDNVLIGLSPW